MIDAPYARRREGPYRFIQNRLRTFLAALKSYAAAVKSKNQLSRDFWADRFSTFATVSATSGLMRRSNADSFDHLVAGESPRGHQIS
jgi:hypothetical protein